MFRLLLATFFYVTLGRWMYAELTLIVPSALPAIDYALEKVQIPTHDEWDLQALLAAAQQLTEHGGSALSSVLSEVERARELQVVTAELTAPNLSTAPLSQF
jgi:hypothetical protein